MRFTAALVWPCATLKVPTAGLGVSVKLAVVVTTAAGELESRKELSPVYVAVTLLEPRGSATVLIAAVPPDKVPEPMGVVDPLLNKFTVPLAPEGLTVAVKVTFSPKFEVAVEGESETVVGVRFQTSASAKASTDPRPVAWS